MRALPLRAARAAALAGVLALPLLAAPVPAGATAPAAAGLAAASAAPATLAPTARRRAPARGIVHTWFDSQADLAAGAHRGTAATDGVLGLGAGTLTRRRGSTTYDAGSWTSPWTEPGFGLTELIASWQARTPGDSLVTVEVRVRGLDGRLSSWDTLAHWANLDTRTRRTTVSGQSDDLGRVSVDTWRAAAAEGVGRWQVRVTLLRRAGTSARPSVDAVGAVASRLPSASTPVPTSAFGLGRRHVLTLPEWSQYTHTDHYPQWGGGGEAWCAPTSVSMVLGGYDLLPRPREHRFVPAGHPQPWVDHAARYMFDHGYDGTGNWAFGTAYASLRGTDAFVTRLRSLREAEPFVTSGIPLVASIAWGRGQLTGAPISSSAGHLLVVVGFTARGDVVVNDPAADPRQGERVRRTYRRAEFERLWLRASGGAVYVIRPDGTPLPPRAGRRNW